MILHQAGLGQQHLQRTQPAQIFLGFNKHWDGQAPLNSNTILTRLLWDNIFRVLLAIIGIGNDVHDCYWIFRHCNQPCYLLKTCHVFSHQLSSGSPGPFDPMLSCSYSCCSELGLWDSFPPQLSYTLLIICLGRSCNLDDQHGPFSNYCPEAKLAEIPACWSHSWVWGLMLSALPFHGWMDGWIGKCKPGLSRVYFLLAELIKSCLLCQFFIPSSIMLHSTFGGQTFSVKSILSTHQCSQSLHFSQRNKPYLMGLWKPCQMITDLKFKTRALP